jgi:hypothetical protein
VADRGHETDATYSDEKSSFLEGSLEARRVLGIPLERPWRFQEVGRTHGLVSDLTELSEAWLPAYVLVKNASSAV